MSKLTHLFIYSTLSFGLVVTQADAAHAEVKNIVLVHGANVDGSTWREVYDRLTDEDFKVTIVQMPLTSAEDDIAAVQRVVDVQEGPVLLGGHSYGGVVIGEVGVDPKVKGLVYIAAFQPDTGESGGSLMASMPSGFTADKVKVFKDGHYLIREDALLYVVANGLSDEDAVYLARSQAASNSSILEYRSRLAAWNQKPSWSAIAALDRTIAPDLQRQMARRAGSITEEVENGHMLPMTNPDEVADLIRRAAISLE